MNDKPLDVGDLVAHIHFGDGKIDQRRDGSGGTLLHVHFAKVSAWIAPSNLKRIAADAPDAQAVAHLERTETDYAGA